MIHDHYDRDSREQITHDHERGEEGHHHEIDDKAPDNIGKAVFAEDHPRETKMFVIEEIWRDSLENQIDSAIGYKAVAVVMFESIAERIVKEGGVVDDTFCWAVGKGVTLDKYRYKEVPVWV